MVESKIAEVLKDTKHVVGDAMEAVGQTKRVYGARLWYAGCSGLRSMSSLADCSRPRLNRSRCASRSRFCPFRSLPGGYGRG